MKKQIFMALLLLCSLLSFAQAATTAAVKTTELSTAMPADTTLVLQKASKKAKPVSYTGTITRVKDGDTYVLTKSATDSITLRLAAVDCPEKKQPFGKEATEFAKTTLLGQTVTVFPTMIDRYGRTIGWVFYGPKYKTNFSKELLKAGLAMHYVDGNRYLQYLENVANKNKTGLWIQPKPIPPSKWRAGVRQ